MSDYVPNPVPASVDSELARYLQEELQRIAASVNVNDSILLETLYAEPKREEGRLVKADGTKWNPGNGQGVYVFLKNRWRKL